MFVVLNSSVGWNISIVENTGQRLNIVKFPRIVGHCWRERIKKGRKRVKESGPAAIPGIPLIWNYVPYLMD